MKAKIWNYEIHKSKTLKLKYLGVSITSDGKRLQVELDRVTQRYGNLIEYSGIAISHKMQKLKYTIIESITT